MLEANKSAIFERVFALYNRNLLRRRFHSLMVSGLDLLLNKDINFPLIIYCNHSSWWDGLVAFQVSFETYLNAFVMMEEKHLKALFLFRKLGAFSVVREKPREAVQSIDYAARLLRTEPNSTLWIFPQGEILPNDLRPLKFYPGVSRIVEKIGTCQTASLSMRYEFMGEFKPQIFVKVDKAETIHLDEQFNRRQLTAMLAQRLTDNLDSLKQDVTSQRLDRYVSIL